MGATWAQVQTHLLRGGGARRPSWRRGSHIALDPATRLLRQYWADGPSAPWATSLRNRAARDWILLSPLDLTLRFE